MNRIENLFKRKEFALIFYLTVGEPSLEDSLNIALALSEEGADCLELGVPFSDPLADGATIQSAMHNALAQGVRLKDVLEMGERIREKSNIPLILMGYYNPFYQYGLERLSEEARKKGIDGFIVPDLPPEEAGEFLKALKAQDLCMVFLLAPTSDEDRYRLVGRLTNGFIYYVSVKGTTGAREELPEEIEEKVKAIKRITKKPVAVGFGISRPEHIKWIKTFADGAVIGSALLRVIRENRGDRGSMLREIRRFTSLLLQEAHK